MDGVEPFDCFFSIVGPIIAFIVIIRVYRWWSKPPRFQISLLTAIMLMFVIGLLIWLNIREQIVAIDFKNDAAGTHTNYYGYGCGWPVNIWWSYHSSATA